MGDVLANVCTGAKNRVFVVFLLHKIWTSNFAARTSE